MKPGKFVGILAAFLSAAFYGLNPLFALPMQDAGMGAWSIVFYRYALALPIIGGIALASGTSLRVTIRQCAYLAILGITMAYSSLALFISYTFMEAAIASTMLFLYPLLVSIIMAVFFRERPSIATIACLVGASVGVFFLYNGEGSETLSLAGSLWVISASLTYAIYLVGLNLSGINRLSPYCLSFYTIAFGTLFFIILSFFGKSIELPDSLFSWANAVGMALFTAALSLWLTAVAIKRIGATLTAIFGVFEPLTGVFVGVAIYGEVLTIRDIVGVILILISVSVEIIKTK